MFGRHETEVVVVGGGPIGLFAALQLTERGIRTEVYDENWRTAAHSYALALHPHSLRLLDELGLAAPLVAQGRRISKVGFYEDARRRASLDLSLLPGRYPFVLVLPQSLLEGVLEDALLQRKVKVQWNHRIEELHPREDGVQLTVARMQKETRGYPVAHTEWVVGRETKVQAAWVIGADGYNSLTRRSLDLEYVDLGGKKYFAVFEMDAPHELDDEVRVQLDPDTLDVLWPMAEGRCRWSFQVQGDDGGHLSTMRLRDLIGEREHWFGPAPESVIWSSIVQFEHRLAERFGRGRVWLAGDSAHLTDPMGAQSMNAGLLEAHELTRCIYEIMKQGASDSMLADYDTERSREWKRLLNVDSAIRTTSSVNEWVGEERKRILPAAPATGADLDRLLAQVGLELQG